MLLAWKTTHLFRNKSPEIISGKVLLTFLSLSSNSRDQVSRSKLVTGCYTYPNHVISMRFRIMIYVDASVVYLVARWTTDHYHLSSNVGVDISEWCFIFRLRFITFGGRSSHLACHVHTSGRKTSIVIIMIYAPSEFGIDATAALELIHHQATYIWTFMLRSASCPFAWICKYHN